METNIDQKPDIAAVSPAAPPRRRIWELDFVRGLCVALMILDHLLYDLGFVFPQQWFAAGGSGVIYELCCFAHDFYWDWPLRHIIRVLVLAGFIGSCGISCSLSRSNLRRGLKLLAVALALSGATALLDLMMRQHGFFISFGVLHMLALSMLIYAGLNRFGPWPSLILGAAILIASLFVGPESCSGGGFFLYALGLGSEGVSADYFPLIPYLGWFLVGAVLGGRLYRDKRSFFPQHGHGKALKPCLWLGRHALLCYILHQPAIYLILLALGKIFS